MSDLIHAIHGAWGLHFYEWVFLVALFVSVATMLAGLFHP